MKKILFASAFALMGTFAMANETISTKEKVQEEGNKSEKEESVYSKKTVGCSSYFEVLTSCENDYFLCNDDYGPNGTRNIEEDLIYFENIKCN